jgi:hypothetical protein
MYLLNCPALLNQSVPAQSEFDEAAARDESFVRWRRNLRYLLELPRLTVLRGGTEMVLDADSHIEHLRIDGPSTTDSRLCGSE